MADYEFATMDIDDSGIEVILEEHPEVKILFRDRDKIDGDIEINGINPISHVAFEAIAENQINGTELPEVRQTFGRLVSKGISRHAARGAITILLMSRMHETFQGKPFDQARYVRQLSVLGTDQADVGRNRPCPCGSGVKFKKCCGLDKDICTLRPDAGRLLLGYGAFVLDEKRFKDPLDPMFQLENRVHIARFLEQKGEVESAKQALEENIAFAENYEGGRWLRNALQDYAMLCFNHRELAAVGITTVERLLPTATDLEEIEDLRCWKADLLARAGRYDDGEREYQKIFQAMPDWHFSRYRYAVFLDSNDKRQEAITVLQEIIAQKDTVDKRTRETSRELLLRLEKPEE